MEIAKAPYGRRNFGFSFNYYPPRRLPFSGWGATDCGLLQFSDFGLVLSKSTYRTFPTRDIRVCGNPQDFRDTLPFFWEHLCVEDKEQFGGGCVRLFRKKVDIPIFMSAGYPTYSACR